MCMNDDVKYAKRDVNSHEPILSEYVEEGACGSDIRHGVVVVVGSEEKLVVLLVGMSEGVE